MNRDTIFRGIDIHSGLFVRGSYANFLKIDEEGSPEVHAIISKRGTWSYVVPESVGQFTGLRDKIGCQIYDGDIVEWEEGEAKLRAKMIWRDVHARYELSEESIGAENCYPSQLTVIGNVHQNPELI